MRAGRGRAVRPSVQVRCGADPLRNTAQQTNPPRVGGGLSQKETYIVAAEAVTQRVAGFIKAAEQLAGRFRIGNDLIHHRGIVQQRKIRRRGKNGDTGVRFRAAWTASHHSNDVDDENMFRHNYSSWAAGSFSAF